jgi:hypothetical protein
MSFFYFDETIQEKAGFIIGAYVYSPYDLTPSIHSAIESVGLRPKHDEFKSGARMIAHPEQIQLRNLLSSMIRDVKTGIIVHPAMQRETLGSEALKGLSKIILANNLEQKKHTAFFDSGINIEDYDKNVFKDSIGICCDLHPEQNSKLIGGIQLADLVAHSLGMMLLEQLGLISKKVRVGENSGYDPDLEVELGFELWASLRYSFF